MLPRCCKPAPYRIGTHRAPAGRLYPFFERRADCQRLAVTATNTDNGAMKGSPVLALLLCGLGCDGQDSDPQLARVRGEVAELRAEVAELRRDVERQREDGTNTSGHQSPLGDATATGKVTLSLSVNPPDAMIYVDGRLIEQRTIERNASNDTLRIRVEKTGFRVIEQTVALTRSHTLHYNLSRGRGMLRRPTAR